MGKSYNTIAFYPDKCNGCNDCVTACAKIKTGTESPEHSRIALSNELEEKSFGISLCRQCGDPLCVMNCPSGALTKDIETGVVQWDESKCVRCQICTLACSYAGITHNPITNQVMKCDLCGNDPACIKVCEPKALEFNTASDIYNEYGKKEDLFVPGVSSCLGCNSELIMRHTLRRVGRNSILATPPGCIAGVGSVGVNGLTSTKTSIFIPLLTNTASMLAGVKRYYNRIGRDITMLALTGDGATADIGFQSLSGAAERGEQMVYICIDNEGYMNTGAQRSSTTPYGSWTSTSPVGKTMQGKKRHAKNMPLLMVGHNCEYVATASLAFMHDYYAKLDKAIAASKKGMAYIHIFSPCPTGWRFPPNRLIDVCRQAVETNMVPLWEYENEKGQIEFTHPVDNPQPVEDYLSTIGKYRHLSKDQISHLKQITEERITVLKKLAV